MPWYAWASLVLNLILLAVAWHYADVAKAQRGLVGYWQARYDRERKKRVDFIASMVKARRKERV